LQPSTRREALADAVDTLAVRAAAALGLPGGILKGDLVLDEAGRLHVIEVAARLSGGPCCTLTRPPSTGVDLVEAVARHAVGLPVELAALRPRHWRPVANRYFLPPPGRLVAVEGFAAAACRPGVAFAELGVRPGDRIRPLTDHTRRVGSVIAIGATAAEAVARAEGAVAAVRFHVEPEAGAHGAGPARGGSDAAVPRYGVTG